MKKKLELVIEDTCHNCLFCRYDSYYSMSKDSGFDCKNVDKRIANDYEIEEYRNYLEKLEENKKVLFPEVLKEIDNPMRIPEFCPLESI